MQKPERAGEGSGEQRTVVGTLPYGPVMATAGSAVLAGVCGLGILTEPLLVLAIAQAVWIAATGAVRRREPLRHPVAWLAVIGHPNEHSGVHTVPLGLAIITGAPAAVTAASGNPAFSAWQIWVCLALTWITAVICIARCTAALAVHPWAWEDVDGTWFLVPAAALGVAVATVDAAANASVELRSVLHTMALAAGTLGWLGYWLTLAAAALRVHRYGLGPAPHAPWWIAMGCTGLAAAMGNLLGAAAWPPAVDAALKTALL